MTLSIDAQKKKIIFVSRILIIFVIITTLIVPVAKASRDNSWPLMMAEQIANGPMNAVKEYTDTEGVQSSIISTVDSETFINDNFNSVYGKLKALGILWAFAIAITHMLQAIEQGQEPTEQVFKSLLEIALVSVLIINADNLINLITKVGELIISYLQGVSDMESYPTGEALLIALTGDSTGGVGWWLKSFAMMLFPWAFSWLIIIAIKFAILQILIEIGIRKIFLPLAIADVYKEGMRSPGIRYLKRLLAVYLKLAICVAVPALVTILCDSLLSNVDISTLDGCGDAISYLFQIVTINFTACGLMFKTGEIANDIVGA